MSSPDAAVPAANPIEAGFANRIVSAVTVGEDGGPARTFTGRLTGLDGRVNVVLSDAVIGSGASATKHDTIFVRGGDVLFIGTPKS
jgi:small nuclear ribonucleoprotein (snRNP)-like protein